MPKQGQLIAKKENTTKKLSVGVIKSLNCVKQVGKELANTASEC